MSHALADVFQGWYQDVDYSSSDTRAPYRSDFERPHTLKLNHLPLWLLFLVTDR